MVSIHLIKRFSFYYNNNNNNPDAQTNKPNKEDKIAETYFLEMRS